MESLANKYIVLLLLLILQLAREQFLNTIILIIGVIDALP